MLNLFRSNRATGRPRLMVESLGDRNLASSLGVSDPTIAPSTTAAMLSPSVTSIQVVSTASMPSPRGIMSQPIALTGPSMPGAAFLQINSMVCIFDGSAVFSGTVTRVTMYGLESTPIAGMLGAPHLGGSRISTCNIHFSGFGNSQVCPGQFALHQMQYDGTLDLGSHNAWTGGAFSDLTPGYGGVPPTWVSGVAVY
jgi:hypothetical protein